jgi:hypothetical protein
MFCIVFFILHWALKLTPCFPRALLESTFGIMKPASASAPVWDIVDEVACSETLRRRPPLLVTDVANEEQVLQRRNNAQSAALF